MFEMKEIAADGRQTKRLVSWSYSKIKNFRSCPNRHYHYDILKDVHEEKSEHLAWGDDVHAAMAARVGRLLPLPVTMVNYEPLAQEFLRGADQPGVIVLTEQKYAIDKDFRPCAYFDHNTWFRAIADAVKIVPVEGGAVALNWDWKTGVPPSFKNRKDDPMQIVTAAACIMIHHPEVTAVRNEFVWMEHGIKTRVDVNRGQLAQIWADMMPEVEAYQEAVRTQNFPARKNGLCSLYCGVTSCEFHPENT